MADQSPLYNLKAVLQQTGLKPDTVRAWERRYGVPAPARSSGGQRLYTQRDVETIRWLQARLREGLSISRAVGLYRQIEAKGHDPLQPLGPVLAAPGLPVVPPPIGSTLQQLRAEWLDACLSYDEQRALRAVSQAFALYPPEAVCLDLLQWAVREVGDLWYRGLATVHQEHWATEQAVERLGALLAALPAATRPGRVLAACPRGEHHTFGLLLLTFLLRRRGWAVTYLGADVPADNMDAAVAAIRPDLIVLAAQHLPAAAAVLATARQLQGYAMIGFAGGAFDRQPAIQERIPGFYLGASVGTALDAVDTLLTTPQPAPPARPIAQQVSSAQEHLRERRSSIAAGAADAAAALGFTPDQVGRPIEALSDQIDAALSLGDVSLLEGQTLVAATGFCPGSTGGQMLSSLLRAYLQAAEVSMDERGKPILDWLRARLGD